MGTWLWAMSHWTEAASPAKDWPPRQALSCLECSCLASSNDPSLQFNSSDKSPGLQENGEAFLVLSSPIPLAKSDTDGMAGVQV